MKKSVFTKITIGAFALNLVGCSAEFGGGGANFVTLIAAAIPVGAIVTLADDGDGGTISTTQQNQNSQTPTGGGGSGSGNGNGNGMTGGGGNDMSGNGNDMNGGDNMDNMDGMDNNMDNMDGMDNNMDNMNPMPMTPTPQEMATSFLDDLPTTATTGTLSFMANPRPMFARTASNGITSVTINSDSYSFATAPTTLANTQGYVTSATDASGNNALIVRTEGSNIASDFGFYHIFTGTNLGAANQNFASYDILATIPNPTLNSAAGTATVGYSGRYTITSLPTGDITTGFESGTVNINVDFSARFNAISGQAFDNSGARSGTISGGILSSQSRDTDVDNPTGLAPIRVFSSTIFTGSGSLDGIVYNTLEGGFSGTNSPTGIYAHSAIGTTGMADRTTMTIIGEMQANPHNFNN